MATLLDEITGNLFRSQALLTIVKEALDEGDATLEKVQAKTSRFNDSFGKVTPDEFAIAVSMLSPDADASGVGPTPVEPDASAVAPTAVTEPPMTRDEANAELRARQDALHSARTARMRAEDDQRRAREAMAQAILEWNAGGPTPDVIRRNEIAAINADREAKRERPTHHVADSYFDRAGAYGRGDATNFARQSHPASIKEAQPGPQPFRGGRRHARGDVFVRGPAGGSIVSRPRVPSKR